MDRTKQATIAIIVAVAMMLAWLLAGCTNRVPTDGPRLILDGVKINEEMPVHLNDGRLMMSERFIQEVLNKKVEWREKKQGGGVYYSDQVAVLMYHDIALSPESDGIIAVERFERQMKLLKDNGFQVISMEQYTSFMLDHGTVPDNAVLITFDDGYESFYKQAYPILIKYGYTAVNFVIVSAIDDRMMPGTPKLTWEQMREMKKTGMSFRSHTYNQHRYGAVNKEGDSAPVTVRKLYDKVVDKQETGEQYVTRIAEDLQKAEDRLREELGNTQSALAFPYGTINDELLKLTDAAGIAITFSTREGVNSTQHRMGYRINGALKGETEEALIARIKQLGGYSDQGVEEVHGEVQEGMEGKEPTPGRELSHRTVLYINGHEAVGVSFLDDSSDQGRMIVLRDFCDFLGWNLHWNNAKKLAEIKTGQGS